MQHLEGTAPAPEAPQPEKEFKDERHMDLVLPLPGLRCELCGSIGFGLGSQGRRAKMAMGEILKPEAAETKGMKGPKFSS